MQARVRHQGDGAQLDPRDCIVMIESVFQAYVSTVGAVLHCCTNGLAPSARACYDRILAAQAQSSYTKGFGYLSTDIDDQRALLRLLYMGRVDCKGRAELFRRAFNELPSSVKQGIECRRGL